MMLGATHGKTIISSRCVLSRKYLIDADIVDFLCNKPVDKMCFDNIACGASSINMPDITAFLYGEDSVDYIKIITPPGQAGAATGRSMPADDATRPGLPS